MKICAACGEVVRNPTFSIINPIGVIGTPSQFLVLCLDCMRAPVTDMKALIDAKIKLGRSTPKFQFSWEHWFKGVEKT